MTRPHHALEGQVLEVFAKVRHKGRPHFLLVLPDGSRSYLPVAWTDFGSSTECSSPPCSIVASASDLLALRQRVDWLLRRIEAAPAINLPTQESHYATASAGAVERGTSPHSTHLSTAHASAAEPSCHPPGPAHAEAGPGSSPKPSSTLNTDSQP